MRTKNVKSPATASRTFQTIQDIYKFEDELLAASLSPEEKAWLEQNENPIFSSEKERDEHLRRAPELHYMSQYVMKGTGNMVSCKDPDLDELVKSGQAILGADYIDRKVIQPFRTGQANEANLELEPIIFKAKGKTAPSVPYLKVSVTTALAETNEASHLLHVKSREEREDL